MTRSLAFSSKAGAAATAATTTTSSSATSIRTSLLPTTAAPGITGTQLFTFQKPPYERYVIPTYNIAAAAASSVDMVPPLPQPETTELDAAQQQELQRRWTALWQKVLAIGPIKPNVGLASLDCLSCSGMAIVWYIVVTTWVDPDLQNDHSLVVFLLALVALQTLVAACRNHAKMRRFEALTALCNSSEHGTTTDGSENGDNGTEVQALRRLGYSVEYQHTGEAGTPEYLYLYTIPIVASTSLRPPVPLGQGVGVGPRPTGNDNQDMATLTQFVQRNGYLRLETFNTSKSYRNPVLLPLASMLLSSLPHVPEFERLEYGHHRVWTDFWLDQYQALEQRQATHDFFLYVVWIYPLLAMLLVWGLLTENLILIAVAVLGKILFCFAACANISSSKRRNKAAQAQLQDDLARCGYYWESRTVYNYSKSSAWLLLLSGTPHYIHYFYLFSTTSISAEAAAAAAASSRTPDELC